MDSNLYALLQIPSLPEIEKQPSIFVESLRGKKNKITPGT